MKALIFFLLSLTLGSLSSAAESVVVKRKSELKRLVPLQKVTVGSDDQYNGAIDPSGKFIVYTHKTDLVAHLDIQDMVTGESMELLPLDADSEEPSYSPKGLLAFTYFKFNSRGDICWVRPPTQVTPDRKLSERDIHCLGRLASSARNLRGSAVWKSENEIVFVEQSPSLAGTRVMAMNISTGAESTLAQGQIWAPDLRPNGKFLTFNEWWTASGGGQIRRLVLLEIATGKKWNIKLALPGISGFPRLSEDEKFLYFSHYMEDTNNDQAIDGNDSAVIFRVPIDTILQTPPATNANAAGTEIFPEQLTPIENGCSFPHPALGKLFATCQFEGSLDVYQIPASGIVPVDWTQAVIQNMLDNARSYEDRVLLLNTLKYRFQASGRDFDEKLLSNHFFSEDYAAAKFYLTKLDQIAATRDHDFNRLMSLLIDGLSLKKIQPTRENASHDFAEQIIRLESEASKVKNEPRTKSLVLGRLHLLRLDWVGAQLEFARVQFAGAVRPMEYGLYFDLAGELERHFDSVGTQTRDPNRLFKIYRPLMAAKELSEQSQIYYAFTFLARLEEMKFSRGERIAAITAVSGQFSSQVRSLLQSEAVVLRIIEAVDNKTKDSIYKELDKLMSDSRSDIFLRRALYVRAIINFSESAQFKFLSFVGNTWLRYTDKDDTEFGYAREVYGGITYDQAYDALAKGNALLADNFFYGAMTLTDDLEAHYGFITAVIREGQRATLEKAYKVLTDHGQIGESAKYAQAVLTLLDAEKAGRKDPRDVSDLDAALGKLNSMTDSRDSAVRYLLLGYCEMEKLLRLADGAEIDNALFQSANHNLMLSYDLGRDNDRIKASALMNLGLLHQRALNFGQSAKYFALREKLGFDSDRERSAFVWLYARSLEHSHQEAEVPREISSLPSTERVGPMEERQAFSLAMSQNFKESEQHYQHLIESGQITGNLNLAKINLVLGYVRAKLGKDLSAKAALVVAIENARKLKKEKRRPDQFVDFDPLRVELSAWGLLAQVGTPQERAAALDERFQLLSGAAESILDDVPSLKIENRVQYASAASGFDLKRSAAALSDALKLAESYGERNGFLAMAVTATLTDSLAFALLHQDLYKNADGKELRKVTEQVSQAFVSQKEAPIGQDLLHLKLSIFWSAYAHRVQPSFASSTETVTAVMKSELSNRVHREVTELEWSQIEKLATVLE